MNDILTSEHHDPERKRQSYIAALLRVYNYYRILVAFSLLLIFVQVEDQRFIGTTLPELFQIIVMTYLGINILSATAAFILPERILSKRLVIFSVLTYDVIFLVGLMYSSGGIQSGLGNILLFTVAYGGVLVAGRLSAVTPALAVLACFYAEFYLHMSQIEPGSIGYFKTGLLGISLFVVNMLFQYVSKQLQERELEISTLEKLHQLEIINQQTREKLDETNSRFKVLLQSAGEGVLGLELDGRVSFANPKACNLLATEHEQLLGKLIFDFLIPTDSPFPESSEDAAPRQGQKIVQTLQDAAPNVVYDDDQWQNRSGDKFYCDYSCEPLNNSHEQMVGLVLIFQDVTQRKQEEQALHYHANYDQLTDIANRMHFQETLRHSMERSKRSGNALAVMFLDLDRFKYINDTLGHHSGDLVLQTVADRLKKTVRATDMVARLGGDEFAVILVDIDKPTNAAVAADSIIKQFERPIDLPSGSIKTATSVGIAIYQGEDIDVDSLLKSADVAMYRAKSEGGSLYRFFHPEMQHEAEEKQRIPMLLDHAIENDEYTLLYQPIVSVKDSRTQCLEALIRWAPEGGDPIPPDTFITIAEDCGKITDIGKWVLRTVCKQAGTWKQEHGVFPNLAINISTKQLASSDFRELFQTEIVKNKISANMIEIELTETSVMQNPDFVMEELNLLHALGVKISVDDFGTGYSSLDYLRRLPLDTLKIDKSFTSGIGESKSDEEIIRLMIAMAHTLGLEVIAEGVETEEQLDFLANHGCDLIQGYIMSRPKQADTVVELFGEVQPGAVS